MNTKQLKMLSVLLGQAYELASSRISDDLPDGAERLLDAETKRIMCLEFDRFNNDPDQEFTKDLAAHGFFSRQSSVWLFYFAKKIREMADADL